MDRVLPMLFVASYNELEQLHIKLSFGHFFVQSIQILKKQPNDNLTLACAITLVYCS